MITGMMEIGTRDLRRGMGVESEEKLTASEGEGIIR
jgi:hypothetical protein